MLRRHATLLAITILSSFHLHAEQQKPASAQTYPAIPTAALEHYTVSVVDEQVETMRLPRLRLTGRKTLQMDILANHISMPSKGQCSARLAIANSPDIKIEFLIFSSTSFQYPLNDDSLNLYLAGLKLRHKPSQAFTILEESAFNENGRAKFRILGQRAMTIRYSFQHDDQTIICGENWIERDGTIYIVRVQAPSRAFSSEYEDARATLNSISELK